MGGSTLYLRFMPLQNHRVRSHSSPSAVILSQAFTHLDVPDVPIPFNTGLMEATLPSVERIRLKIQA